MRRLVALIVSAFVFFSVGLCLAAANAAGPKLPGKTAAELFPFARFDPAIPTQRELLGFHPGARPLRHAELMRYLERLASASPRARLETYAHTYEGRKLVVFAVSDVTTIGGLESFRDEHAKRVDPRGRPESQDAALLDQAKAVAWIAYGIHGDELSSVDAAAAMAYWLVAGEDERTTALRRELVILIDPMENPDGRDRYLAQTAAFAHRVPNHDTEDLSHTTVWPWGRGNHYLFDLNRDWFSMVHPESTRSEWIARWNPQLMVDSHEMGPNNTYLLSPPRQPFNPHLPSSNMRWAETFGNDQARGLDERGYPYYAGEWNEEFFPGYGSSWASYRGAVGILYEMSRTSGTLVKKRSGSLRDYGQAVEHQVASSIANLETLARNRGEILADFVADRRKVIASASEPDKLGAWILPRGRHPERTDALVNLLRKQGIEVLRSSQARPAIAGLTDALTGKPVTELGEVDGAWAVPMNQPAAPLARVILDPHVPMDAKFLSEQREYLERGKGSRLYDVTAWALPLCYGIEAYWTTKIPGEGWRQDPVAPVVGSFASTAEPFGYLIEGRSDATVGALAELLQRGLHVQVADRPFAVDGRSYEQASLLIQREGNPADLTDQLEQIASIHGVQILPTPTARAERGPDLGGSHFKKLVAPRVGVFTGYPISPSQYGALWHLLDEQVGLRFTAIDLGRAATTDLDRYNVLVFPPSFGGAASYASMMGEAGVARLKRWIESGGSAIGIGSGAEFLAGKQHELTRTRLRREALDRYPPVVVGIDALEAERAGPFRSTGIRAAKEPEPEQNVDSKKKSAAKGVAKIKRESPYDVAPVLGPGARPFARGVELGTAVPMKPVDLSSWLEPFLPPGKKSAEEEDLAQADARLRRFAPSGSFLRLELDNEMWLAWGLPSELPALVRARDTLVAEPPVQVAAQFADLERLHLGGLLWPEAAGRLARTAYATREGVGRGQVILFLNDPEFRGWTLATRRLLTNAMLYGPGLGTRWSTPW